MALATGCGGSDVDRHTRSKRRRFTRGQRHTEYRRTFRFVYSNRSMLSITSPSSLPTLTPTAHPVCRGVRGATTIRSDTRDEILTATRQLLALMIRRNDIHSVDVASAIFTVTHDITAEFPALAARQLGWIDVPLLCGYEVSVPGSLPRCIRILVHWNTTRTQKEILHTYMREATALRPDLTNLPPVDFDELESWIRQQMDETG